jgi:hypothetical protein
MSNRRLLILSFITLVIIIAAVISSKDRAPQSVIESAELFPGLKDQINNVAEITIESASATLNIKKQGENWLITEAGDYPARFDKIKQTALTDLQSVAVFRTRGGRHHGREIVIPCADTERCWR